MPTFEMLKFDKRKTARRHIKKADHKPHAGPEHKLQTQCEEVLEIMHVQYIHIPNALFSLRISWINKMFKGLPDLIIFGRGQRFDRVLFVELKRDTGEFSGGQKTFARWFHVFDVRDVEDFTDLLNEFLRT